MGLLRHQRNEVVFADALQHQEGQRRLSAVGDQMRPARPDDMDLTGLQLHFLLRLLQEQPHLAFRHIERIRHVGVGMPPHLLLRRQLQLRNAKAGAGGGLGAALDVLEVIGVLDRLPLLHAGLPCWRPYASLVGPQMKPEEAMGQRINRCIELLEQDQAISYDGPHSGHVLTSAQGRIDAATWADYMNVGMEHGSFDMTGLEAYMRGMVEATPTRSGHRTPVVIVEAPVNGIDAAHVRYNAWQFRQILGRGAHGILLCQAETADAVRAFVESCRYPHNIIGVDPAIPTPLARMEGAKRAADGGTDLAGRKLLGIGTRGRGARTTAAPGLGGF